MSNADEKNITSVRSLYTHLANTNEQTAITFTPAQNCIIDGIWLDTSNLTQAIIIRIYRNGILTQVLPV